MLSDNQFADIVGRLKRSEFIVAEAERRGTQTMLLVFGGAVVAHGFGMRGRGIGDVDIIISPVPYSDDFGVGLVCGSFKDAGQKEQLLAQRLEIFNSAMRVDGFMVDIEVIDLGGNGHGPSYWVMGLSFIDMGTGLRVNPSGEYMWNWAKDLSRQQLTFVKEVGHSSPLQIEFMGSAMTVLTKYAASFGVDSRLESRNFAEMV